MVSSILRKRKEERCPSPDVASLVVPDELWDGLLASSSDEEDTGRAESLIKDNDLGTTNPQGAGGIYLNQEENQIDYSQIVSMKLSKNQNELHTCSDNSNLVKRFNDTEKDTELQNELPEVLTSDTVRMNIIEAMKEREIQQNASIGDDEIDLEFDLQFERQLEAQQAEHAARQRKHQDSAEVASLIDSPIVQETCVTFPKMKNISTEDNKINIWNDLVDQHCSEKNFPPSDEDAPREHSVLQGEERTSYTAEDNNAVNSFEENQSLKDEEDNMENLESRNETGTANSARDREASPAAVAALWELLSCCIGARLAATEAIKSYKSKEEIAEEIQTSKCQSLTNLEFSYAEKLQDFPQGPAPCLRWYDSRARVALRVLCEWLQVPNRKLTTLEVLLGFEKIPEKMFAKKEDVEEAAIDQYRHLKVGLAALGGGALFAVTGGLAAPAIAAGVGSLLGIVPGASAAAGAVAGFMSTSAGVAAVTTTMATAGAATTGTRMANRTAEVKDFGFLPLKEAIDVNNFSKSTSSSSLSSKNRFEGSNDAHISASPSKEEVNGDLKNQEGDDPGHLTLSSSFVAKTRPVIANHSQSNGSHKHALRTSYRLDKMDKDEASSSWFSRTGSSLSTDKSAQYSSFNKPTSPSSSSPIGNKRTGDSSSKEKLDLLQSPVRVPRTDGENVQLSVVIGISGWINKSPEDFVNPWRALLERSPASDVFGMVWCTSELQALASALSSLIAKGAAGQAARLGMQHLVVGGAGLVTALGPTVLLGAATGLAIDNAWTTAGERADKAGKLLGQVLMNGGSGGRPVTLVAHSMGARAAFSALLELCRFGARGIIQDVVLLGAPVSTTEERWRMARRVVAGRLVNGYSRKDWLLGTLYLPGLVRPPAGLAPIQVDCIENISLGSIVTGHFEYLERMGEIMDLLQVLSMD